MKLEFSGNQISEIISLLNIVTHDYAKQAREIHISKVPQDVYTAQEEARLYDITYNVAKLKADIIAQITTKEEE